MPAFDLERSVPFVVDSESTTVPLNGGPIAVPLGLRNIRPEPMLVDEIRVYSISTPFPLLRLHISVGRQVICDDMPPELIERPLDLAQELDLAFAGAVNHTQATHIWRFPKPLFIPKASQLNVKYALDNRSGPITSPPSTASVCTAMLGRSLPPDTPFPQTVAVPFATRWISSLAPTTQGQVLTDQSQSGDLRNTTGKPLRIQRFTYTLVGRDANGNAIADVPGAGANCKVRIFGEGGIMGVRDQTPVGVLFHHGSRSWSVSTVARPNGFFVVDVDYKTLVLGVQRVLAAQLGVGLVGYREVPFEEVGF